MSDDPVDADLPEGWAGTTVGEVSTQIQYGYTASASNEEDGPKFLRITDIQDGLVEWNTVPSCKITSDDIARFALAPGDIVFARTGATTGKSYLIGSCPSSVFASYLIRLRPRPPLDPRFLSLFFQTPDYWQFISENVSGNAQPNCNASKLAALPMPLPPLAEQKRIVAKVETLLARVNAARQRLAKVPSLLKRFRQSVLAAACSGQLTEDWRNGAEAEWSQVLLRDVGTVSGGITKNQQRAAMAIQTPYLRVANVYANRLELGEMLQIGVTDGEFARTELRDGDLLFVEGNASLDQIGRVAMWDGSIPRCVHQNHIIKFRPGTYVVAKYALFSMMSPSGREQLIEKAISSAGLHSLSISKIADVNLEMPPLAEQHEIVRCVEALLARADRIEKRLATATRRVETLTQAILGQAFRGELVTTEAELARQEGRDHEPAAVLLERIRAKSAADRTPVAKQRGKRQAN